MGLGLALLLNLTVNFLSCSLLTTHFNRCPLLKPAYPSWALWIIFLYPADLHFLNVFSTTLLASKRFRTCEMVKRKFVQYLFLHFLTYKQIVQKKKTIFFVVTQKNGQKYCENSSIFPIVCPNTLQSRIQITWHYRQPKEKEILDEKSLSISFQVRCDDPRDLFPKFLVTISPISSLNISTTRTGK